MILDAYIMRAALSLASGALPHSSLNRKGNEMNSSLHWFIARIGVLCLFVAISGCASLPTPEEMKADTATYQLPKLPEANKAMVYVVRPSGLGGLIRFNVFVGDQEAGSEMGYTRSKQYIYFHVPPGEHKIFSKAENWAEVTISAQPGEVIYVQQHVAMGIIMARNNLSRLEEYEGKYQVKNLTIGTVLKIDK